MFTSLRSFADPRAPGGRAFGDFDPAHPVQRKLGQVPRAEEGLVGRMTAQEKNNFPLRESACVRTGRAFGVDSHVRHRRSVQSLRGSVDCCFLLKRESAERVAAVGRVGKTLCRHHDSARGVVDLILPFPSLGKRSEGCGKSQLR